FQIYTVDLPCDAMLGKIAISMGLAGIAIPVGWWAARSGRRKVWGFSGDETEADIIRKAITGPMRRMDFETITATVRGTEYKGILLEERERRFFLGPQLEVVPKQAALTSKQDREFASKVVSESGQIIDRKRLAELVKRKKLQIGAPVKVTRGGVASATLVCMVESKLDVADHHPAPLVKAAERD